MSELTAYGMWLVNEGLDCGTEVSIIDANTPAMPLYDAHFGGFFLPGVCV